MLESGADMTFRAPIFVIGPARSGTTLLQTMLGAHPCISALPEMHFWFRIVDLVDYWGDVADAGRFRAALSELVSLPGGLLEGAGFQVDRILDQVSSPRLEYRDLLDALGRDLVRRQDKARWSEKTPWQSAGQIWQLFPEAQVIHLIREPRDTVASILRAPFNDQPAWALAGQWARYTAENIHAGTDRGPEHYHQVRYEDLVRAPLATLGLVCRFLNEEFESSMLVRRPESTALFTASGPDRMLPWQAAATGPVGPLQLGAGGSGLPARDRALLGLAVRGRCRMLGYEEPRLRTLLAGWLLWGLTVPTRLAPRLRRLWDQPLGPAERYEVVLRYIDGRVAAALGSGPEHGPTFTDDEDFSPAAVGAVLEVVAEALAG
jgi:hypothetical protein